MMSELIDASEYGIAKRIMNINILRQIEDDLDIDEKISILFLIIEDYTNVFTDVLEYFQKAKTENAYIITNYVKTHPENWEDKVLEALCILNNRNVIRKLRVPFENLEEQYCPKFRLYTKSINRIAKCLYVICESLNEEEQKLLLNHVKSENSNYEPLLDNVDCLELHMLYWIHHGYITISRDKRYNMRKLLKHLKKFDNLKIICMELEKYENHLHVTDACGILPRNDESYIQSISIEKPLCAEKHFYRKKLRPINNGLCVIINQIYFDGNEYETRFGTTADCISLTETFQTFGFRVYSLENLNKKEMIEKIRSIPRQFGNEYDCLFLCILSHGYKGGIIASDEQKVSLEAIERAVCCIELKNVMKIVIIQACQGKTRGSVNSYLTTDGLSDSPSASEDVSRFENFFMFISTIQGFISIRHKEQGSWFIQEICKIFKTYGNQLTFLECIREIMRSVRKKQGTMEGNQIAQLTEIRQDRLDSDFQLKIANILKIS